MPVSNNNYKATAGLLEAAPPLLHAKPTDRNFKQTNKTALTGNSDNDLTGKDSKKDRPPSEVSKYSAVVFTIAKPPPEPKPKPEAEEKKKEPTEEEDGENYDDDFDDDFEPYETSNENEEEKKTTTSKLDKPTIESP